MCKVLIVDDEAAIRDVVGGFVSDLNFSYKIVSNSVEALIAIEKYQSIRICLIDLHLPGMDGLTLCRKLCKIDPMMIMVAMTGYKTLFSMVECRDAGFDDVLFKPFDFNLLKTVLLEYDAKLKRWQNQT